jgi:hypothetical protein
VHSNIQRAVFGFFKTVFGIVMTCKDNNLMSFGLNADGCVDNESFGATFKERG